MPWFYARTDEDSSVLNATLDDALDSLRFFAEASDRLEAVDLTIDINSDLGLLAGKFIREIRDDYGTSVALPVTLLSNDDDLPALQRNMLAPEKNAQLLQSNLPLLYQDLVDNASLIISLSTRPMFGESSTSIARKTNAKVLDTILSFRGNGCLNGFDSDATIIQSTHEYIEKACSNRKFPIAVVEAWNAELVESVFNEDSIFKSLQQLKAHNVATANDFILNPFLRLMSPLNISTNITYEKPYANFLSITGSAIKDIPRKLFMECFDSKYRMSGCAIYSPAKTSDDR